MDPRKYPKSGFTLIELLVVIAIIGMLAAILFPVFARARENARRSSCLSNMKQASISCLQYFEDNDGRMMRASDNNNTNPTVSIWEHVMPYLKSRQVLFCPSAPKFKATPATYDAQLALYGQHYGFPVNWVAGAYYCAAVRLAPIGAYEEPLLMSQFVEPARTCLIAETYQTNASATPLAQYTGSGYGSAVFSATRTVATLGPVHTTRHLDGGNYAYLDGHVKWLTESAVDNVFVGQNTSGTGITAANAGQYPIVFCWKR